MTMSCTAFPRRAHGFSLIELMVAMLLGLIVIAGATSAFLASKQTYRTNEALSGLQQNSRVAFELMARDIRQAGNSGCNNNGEVSNVLNNGPHGSADSDWWADWDNAIHGYESSETDPAVTTGTATGERVSGTDSFQVVRTGGMGLSVDTHTANDGTFELNESSTDLESGDIVVVCDQDHMAIVQITSVTNVTLKYTTDTSSPGNCSLGLGYETSCSSTNTYTFDQNSHIARLSATDWYIGTNSEGGQSLYRIDLVNSSGTATEQAEEMVRGVTDMQVEYLTSGDSEFKDANNDDTSTDSTDWTSVTAVRVELTLETVDERAGVDATPITRTVTTTTTIRNRVD